MADHHEIHATLTRITEMCDDLKEGSEVKHLAELMKTYQAMLLPHFKHEEDFTLPLLRAYFTPEGEYNISYRTILGYTVIESHRISCLLHKRVRSCHGEDYEECG
jgi:hypothetical protein